MTNQRQDKAHIAESLGPEIMKHIESGEVSEIMLNPDGTVWVDSFKDGMFQTDIQVNQSLILNMVKAMAHNEKRILNSERPHLQANLPFNNERFQAMIPPVVENVCFSIRTPATRIFKLDEYFVENEVVEKKRAKKQALKKAMAHDYTSMVADGLSFEKLGDFFNLLMRLRKNIFVTGATGSGKTTFLNAILDSEFVRSDRCFVMQDTPELQLSAPNKIMTRWDDYTSAEDLLKIALRMRPDRALIGEVRGAECLDLLSVWNTGHSGGVASAHANSAYDSLSRIEDMLLQHPNISTIPYGTVAAAVDIIVYMENLMIVEVMEVNGHHADTGYQTRMLYTG